MDDELLVYSCTGGRFGSNGSGSICVMFNSISLKNEFVSHWCILWWIVRRHDTTSSLGMRTESGFDGWKWSDSSVLGECCTSISTKLGISYLQCWFVPSIANDLFENVMNGGMVILMWGEFVFVQLD